MEPMLRFKADDGSEFPAWEEKMFWDVFANLTNNTLSRECLNAESGQARNIHYGDVLVKYGAVVDVQRDGVPFVNPDVECKRWDCLKDGDVVIADTAEDETVGKAVEISNAGSDIVYSGLHTIACRPKEEFAPGYLGNYINSMSYHDQLRPYMQGIKVTSVSKTNIGLTHLLVPSLPEQHKIADLLSAVDDVISAQEAEVAAWEKRKKGVMQKLFSQEVRFKADDGSDFPDWESTTVGELFTFVTEKNESGRISDVITNSAEHGLIPQREYFDKDIAVEGNTEGYTVIHKGDFVYNPRKSTIAPFGPFNIYERDEVGIVSPLYTCLTPRDGETAPYLSWYFKTSRWHRYIVTHGAQGGARHDRVGMTNALMKGIPVMLPSLPEQRKIADCLTSLDDVIAKAKDELDAWRELKKGLLQQMFV
mgnify:CR=1 FL=1